MIGASARQHRLRPVGLIGQLIAQPGGFAAGNGDIHAAQRVDDLAHVRPVHQDILVDFQAKVRVDGIHQTLQAKAAGHSVDAAVLAVGAQHQHIADKRGEHDAVRHGIHRHQHDAVGVVIHVVDIALPGVGAQQQVVMHALRRFGDILRRVSGDGLGILLRQRADGQRQAENQQNCNDLFQHGVVPPVAGSYCSMGICASWNSCREKSSGYPCSYTTRRMPALMIMRVHSEQG